MLTTRRIIVVILCVQIASAIFFVANILSSVIGFAPINWQISEYIELGAALGLILGIGLGAVALSRTQARNDRIETQLRAVSGAFMELLDDRFGAWGPLVMRTMSPTARSCVLCQKAR